MIEFVIGGTAQGKLKYVLDKNNLTKEDVCNGEECDYNNINKRVLYNFHLLCRRLLKDNINILSFVEALLEKNNDIIMKRIRQLINSFANAGLNSHQVTNDDLRIILDNFLNGGQTTTFGTVMA